MRDQFGISVPMVVVLLCATLGLTGCYMGDIRDYCENVVECEGGNDNDEDACVESLKGDRKEAKEYGCKSEWDDMLDCVIANSSCESYDYDTYSYSYYGMDYRDCEDKEIKLYNCIAAESSWYDTYSAYPEPYLGSSY